MSRFHISTDATTGQVTTTPFTPAEETAQDAVDAAAASLAARIASFTGDSARAQVLSLLQTSSPSQIRNFVQNQVTDLPSARTLLANMLILIALSINQ